MTKYGLKLENTKNQTRIGFHIWLFINVRISNWPYGLHIVRSLKVSVGFKQ